MTEEDGEIAEDPRGADGVYERPSPEDMLDQLHEALDQGLLNLLVLACVAFLAFSLLSIRRVSRSSGVG